MNQITKTPEVFNLTPTSIDEAMKLADYMSKSDMVPKAYQGKPANIVLAVQMGQSVGLPPMQALQSIAVINGMPSLWGDGALAIVKAHRAFEYCHEEYDATNKIATCVIKRKDQPEVVRSFSWEDATRAKLSGKDTYQQYPQRMLQMRARSWAMRDSFPDALRGLFIAEEVRDYAERDMGDIERVQEVSAADLKAKLAAKPGAAGAEPETVVTRLSEQLLTDLTDKIALAQSGKELEAVGAEITDEIKAQMTAEDVTSLKRVYQARKKDLEKAEKTGAKDYKEASGG
jgi:hypothetical protein